MDKWTGHVTLASVTLADITYAFRDATE